MEHLINKHIQALPKRLVDKHRNGSGLYLDRNEFPYPPSPKVVAAIQKEIAFINKYPSQSGDPLRQAIATYVGTSPASIILGNGSDDLIELLLKVLVTAGKEVLIPAPSFAIYNIATRIIGGNLNIVPRRANFDLDVSAILENVTPATKIIFIANPNNPTGTLVSRKAIESIVQAVSCLVVVDECYYEIAEETVADLVPHYANLFVLRSFSKSFGLAGLRIGYGIGHENLVAYLRRGAQFYPINRLAIAVGVAALQDLEYVYSNIRQIKINKTVFRQALEDMGCIVYPSAANFLLVNTRPLGITSTRIVQLLRERNIWINDFAGKFGFDEYHFRTAVATEEMNQQLILNLVAILQSIREEQAKNNMITELKYST